ncbi:MAG TPA: hydrogen peroxide-dependent heme synthase [Gemmatimonadaceae bacterium]|nr:hydrogen peroxide-dependent heme synthase [Gemmatimonadaceae bacterium]
MTDQNATRTAAERARAHPPETTEGWYAFHQILSFDRAALRALEPDERARLRLEAETALDAAASPAAGGWSAVVPLVGSRADVMLVHFRPTFDGIGDVQRSLARVELLDYLRPVYTFLSVTEAGLYHASAQLATEAAARGGAVGDAAHREAMNARVEAERASAHVQRRLFPPLPAEMPYVCFYPMSKRRVPGQNWYALPLEERSRLMMAHGMTGRGYAGRVMQVITGALGFDAWEWGVTLFAGDPLAFKKIVTDMRFDEVSAQYAEFGDFYVGRVSTPREWLSDVL